MHDVQREKQEEKTISLVIDYQDAVAKRDKLKAYIYHIEVSRLCGFPGPATLCPVELLREELEALNKYIEALEKRAIIECCDIKQTTKKKE